MDEYLLLPGDDGSCGLGQDEVDGQADDQDHAAVELVECVEAAFDDFGVGIKDAGDAEEENESGYHPKHCHGLSTFEAQDGQYEGLDAYEKQCCGQDHQVCVADVYAVCHKDLEIRADQMADQDAGKTGQVGQQSEQKGKEKVPFLLFAGTGWQHLQETGF